MALPADATDRPSAWSWSDAWCLDGGTGTGFDDAIVLAAGPDVRFELDGLSTQTSDTLRAWATGETITDTTDEESELASLLAGLGAINPELPDDLGVAIVSTVDPSADPSSGSEPIGAFVDALTSRVRRVATECADVAVILRSETTWPNAPLLPHLGVDLTHHHTLVLGPFVVPGASSCLSCLARQTERRWGPDIVPARPAIGRWPAVTAELVALQLEAAARGSVPLLNATSTWDLETGQATRDDLLRAPACGGLCRAPSVDFVRLPWLPS